MVSPNPPEESAAPSEAVEIPFPGGEVVTQQKVSDIIKPNGVNILIRPDGVPQMHGGLHMPQNMKSLEFITATVLAKGPDCKFVKEGSRILVAQKALINGEAGVMLDGFKLFFTQENLIVAMIETPVAKE